MHQLTYYYPHLKKDMRIVSLKGTPDEFIDKNLKSNFLYTVLLTVLFFFVLDKARISKFLLIPIFIIIFFLFFNFSFLKLKGAVKKKEREINQEVLFVGDYLLVKLYSGRPLLSALIETSKSRGIVAKSIKELVDDINTGSPIEKALENALLYSPSEKFKKILFQINNALRLGIDVTKPLESVIKELTNDQELEIKKYSKKLNTIVIFYMLIGIVAPSIGMAIFIVLSSFINFPITLREFFVVIFFISLIQIVFISMFKSIRPHVNL